MCVFKSKTGSSTKNFHPYCWKNSVVPQVDKGPTGQRKFCIRIFHYNFRVNLGLNWVKGSVSFCRLENNLSGNQGGHWGCVNFQPSAPPPIDEASELVLVHMVSIRGVYIASMAGKGKKLYTPAKTLVCGRYARMGYTNVNNAKSGEVWKQQIMLNGSFLSDVCIQRAKTELVVFSNSLSEAWKLVEPFQLFTAPLFIPQVLKDLQASLLKLIYKLPSPQKLQ